MAQKTLIVYYSKTGGTERLAQEIQTVSNGALQRLEVPAGTFSADMFATSDEAKQQLASGQLPKLVGTQPDLAAYDLILVGGPVWNGAPSTPVLAFLQAHQNSTVTIAPFYTDAGTPGAYEADFAKAAGQMTVKAGLGMAAGEAAHAQQRIADWYNGL
ncbi:flavodoxin [Lactobacillus selangorensis]|uniref:Flavodoxin n=1 Tax=Lactobacillus selangorensis TaxID=81857 RepID=A0A0R2G0M8_9LACO|nr:flavodoxin [Lactobacillus selangorensis]KRN28137.1 flavodoxin [Lactobacillus selangorensis]KRN30986.1 flavodoxin [Lactobacillus selangorensis]